ncbi:DUF4148 domain-containing protein [Paraburkholderia sp. ZP32-5]|uniref:DUF4148 domain-containing protein n=1 Tax=Paraburkholderia sp. ZP32-5 TaxID=2883245 RepID=UPI001F41E6C2|nr:DUF4148 domain-containing protein [Paraburkholderia sp. ZP32-5]
MKQPKKTAAMAAAVAFSIAGCAAGGGENASNAHLSAAQCRDLTALRNNAPLTRERNASEMAALEKAGYHPGWIDDPYYPDDLQAAQHQVDLWYRQDCVNTSGSSS